MNTATIAVAYDDGKIGEHFGHATMFALYVYDGEDVSQVTKKLIDCSDRHGHKAMADLMKENQVDAVIVSNMGEEAYELMMEYRILPVLGYCGDADTAADMLVTGQLPIRSNGSSCGGGCGGCGGGCHGGGDSGSCGCGCG